MPMLLGIAAALPDGFQTRAVHPGRMPRRRGEQVPRRAARSGPRRPGHRERRRFRAVVCALVAGLACHAFPEPSPSPRVVRGASPSDAERYCSWYADARAGVLYFGQAAFWASYRAAGRDPGADLDREGPQLVGRFDLARERMLEPLDVGYPGARSGVWDVLAHPNGRVYFTTYFGLAGFVDPDTGEVHRLQEPGAGLAELARGPGETLLATRYGSARRELGGSVVRIDADGRLLAEHPLAAPPGYLAAPKSVAFDPGRGQLWVTADLLPLAGDATRHDAYLLDLDGRELHRVVEPEIQFVAFAADGTGYRAERDGRRLWLRIVAPGADPLDPAGARLALLDEGFPEDFDFVQDIQIDSSGRAVVTRWSGVVYAVDRGGAIAEMRLPSLDPEGLYYTAVGTDGRICATYCADVAVVCQSLR